MLSAGAFNAYFDINSTIVYMVWSVLSISLFFEDNLLHLIVLSFGLMYFTGIVDTFSVMLIQIVLIGGGIAGTDITWWMEPAYIPSLFVFFDENSAMYGWDAYVTFFISIAGAIYAIFLTLSIAIKNILSNRQNRELINQKKMEIIIFIWREKKT